MILVEKAAAFAAAAHMGQMRKYTHAPYFTHVEAVAKRVATLTDDQVVIAAAYLHDVLEDTSISEADLRANFGDRVTDIVVELTDHYTVANYPTMNRAQRKRAEAHRLAATSPEAKLVKRADMADNTESIAQYDPKFAKVYLAEKAYLLKLLEDQ